MASPTKVVNLFSDFEDQNTLLRAAAQAIPHQFDKCTYQLGSLRQHVHLCLDCKEPRGLCGGCSVSCHGDHNQIELFPKRDFRCDCPTKALDQPCQLNGKPTARGADKLEINEFNQYNQNYRDGGRFCRCHSLYDGEKERETMVQCLACEDWFHESCLNLRERIPPREDGIPDSPSPPSSKSSPISNSADDASSPLASSQPPDPSKPLTFNPPPTTSQADETAPTERFWDYENEEDDEEEDPSIPKALIPAADYDAFICGECLIQSPMLLKYAGSEGCRMVVREGGGNWFVWADGPPKADANEAKTESKEEPSASSPSIGQKRTLEQMGASPTADGPTKRAKLETGACSAPIPHPKIQELVEHIKAKKGPYLEGSGLHGAGDIFFTPGWRERWCKCTQCSLQVASRPYLEEEEETYELPEDPDAGLSLEELGLKALSKLPRDLTIDGIQAFQRMSAELSAYLAPFAESGKVVTKEDINLFFAARREQRKP